MNDAYSNYTLLKTNNAILVSNNLHFFERKVFNYLVQQIIQKKRAFITLKELASIKGTSNISYIEAKNVMVALGSTNITQVLNGRHYKTCSFISGSDIKNGQIFVRFDQNMLDLLDVEQAKQAGGYTELDLQIIAKLTSSHSIALYEYIKSQIFKKLTIEISFDDLRKILTSSRLLKNKKSTYYESYKRFNDVILKRAVAEINEKTDIVISYESIKMGRSVSDITFFVQKNQNKPINIIQPTSVTTQHKQKQTKNYPVDVQKQEPIEQVKKIMQYGITRPIAERMHQSNANALDAIIQEVNKRYSNKPSTEKAKLIVKMFNDGAHPGKKTPEELKKEATLKAEDEKITAKAALEKEKVASKEKKWTEDVKKVFAHLANLSKEKILELVDAYNQNCYSKYSIGAQFIKINTNLLDFSKENFDMNKQYASAEASFLDHMRKILGFA